MYFFYGSGLRIRDLGFRGLRLAASGFTSAHNQLKQQMPKRLLFKKYVKLM